MKDTLRDQGIVVLLYSLLLRGFAAGETIPPFPELSEVLNVRGGPLKTPFDAECMDEDPVGCPIRAARGDCFGIPGWAKYNGSLDLSELGIRNCWEGKSKEVERERRIFDMALIMKPRWLTRFPDYYIIYPDKPFHNSGASKSVARRS